MGFKISCQVGGRGQNFQKLTNNAFTNVLEFLERKKKDLYTNQETWSVRFPHDKKNLL